MNRFSDPNFESTVHLYDFLKLTPNQFFEIEKLNNPKLLQTTSKYIVGGETLHKRHVLQLFELNNNAEVYNEYGPTETTVGSIIYQFTSKNIKQFDKPFGVPVGVPMKGVQVYVLNEKQEEVAPGEYGEIIIGGIQVSEGYISNDYRIASRFVQNKHNDGSIDYYYRTGDFATKNKDGIIEFVCREDKLGFFQTKQFSSCSIELDLMRINSIQNVLVLAHKNPLNIEYPVCYITLKNEEDDINFIKNDLSKLFLNKPYHAICVQLDEFPLTVNKKIDRHKLPKVELKKESNGCKISSHFESETSLKKRILYFQSKKTISTKRTQLIDTNLLLKSIPKIPRLNEVNSRKSDNKTVLEFN
ncbi:MAG: AMP-binding protein [Bacteroidia bacterium]